MIERMSGSFNLIRGHDRAHDLHFRHISLREERAGRAVRESSSQGGCFGRAAFPFDETARYLAGGVHSLFVIHREGEERRVLLGFSSASCRHQHHGVAVANGYGAAGLLCDEAGLES